jgi:hypothetical protein
MEKSCKNKRHSSTSRVKTEFLMGKGICVAPGKMQFSKLKPIN